MTYYPNKNLVDEDWNFIIPMASTGATSNLSSLRDINFDALAQADKSKIYLLAYFPWKNYFDWVSIDNPEYQKPEEDENVLNK